MSFDLLLCLFCKAKEIALMDSLSFVSNAQSHFQTQPPRLPDFHFAALSCRSHAEDPDRIIELCSALLPAQLFFQIFCAFRELINVVDGFLLGLFRFSLRLSERFLNRALASCCAACQIFLISMIASCCSASGRSWPMASSILAACASSLSSHTRKCF